MLEKEAINFLKDALIDMAQNAEDIDTPRYYFFMLAISALERRVPKTPKKIVIRENLFGKYNACPYCGCPVGSHYDIRCCVNCGQAIDWSAEK